MSPQGETGRTFRAKTIAATFIAVVAIHLHAMARGSITDKWHRVCCGCGDTHHINALKQMDGNECCPGHKFSRDKSKIKS